MRAIFYAALAQGESRLEGILDSPDVAAAIEACEAFGARFVGERVWGVGGRPKTPRSPIQAGNSGLVLRFMGALAALCEEPVVITGDESIRKRRPVQPLIAGLKQLGADAVAADPLSVRGPAVAGRCAVDGGDSQPISALLTLAALLEGETVIEVREPKELPWLEVTLGWLRRLGVVVDHKSYQTFRVQGGAVWPGFSYRPPGDFSSAAFPVAAALATQSRVTVKGIDFCDTQGDQSLFSLLAPAVRKGDGALIVEGGELEGGIIDLDPMIDALPVLAVLGCLARGETRLINGGGARRKECDRIAAMAVELRKMGADITEYADGLRIRPSKLRGARVTSHGDHRVAMALAVAGMAASGETVVEDVACCAKTYPTFAEDLGLCVI